jgi:hypothetical protein
MRDLELRGGAPTGENRGIVAEALGTRRLASEDREFIEERMSHPERYGLGTCGLRRSRTTAGLSVQNR